MELRQIHLPSIATSIIKEGDHDTVIDGNTTGIISTIVQYVYSFQTAQKDSHLSELMIFLLSQMASKQLFVMFALITCDWDLLTIVQIMKYVDRAYGYTVKTP